MQIKENISLAPYTTFKIGGPAKFFCVVKDQFNALEAYEFAKEKKINVFVLGGGSNVLISDKGYGGLVIKVENKGIEILQEDDSSVTLKVASGEIWDEVVKFCVNNNWWGLENLSHIPGSTGAIAVQNVGAYGQEAKNVIDSVIVFNRESHEIQSINANDCDFSYRSSIFNTGERGKYIIFYILFRLQKTPNPILSYRELKTKFEGTNPSQINIRQAVIEIRDRKFPFPTEAKKGNAGSFFKNPILTKQEFVNLKQKIEKNFGSNKVEELETKKFIENNWYKLPAAFLIELCKLKNLEINGAAINPSQPLVIINKTGAATSTDVLNLANYLQTHVFVKTGIKLNFEPELIGF